MRNNKFYQLERTGKDTLDMYLYSDVESDSKGWFGETIISETSSSFYKETLLQSNDVKYINVHINSLGGEVKEGIAIYNLLKQHKAYVTVYIDGFACSIASVIAMSGNKVVMPRNSIMMIHNVWTCTYGNASELEKTAADLKTIDKALRTSYLEKSNGKLSEDKLIELLAKETFLTAEDCINYGLADEYGDEEFDIEEARNMLNHAMIANSVYASNKLQKIVAFADKEKLKQTDNKDNHSDNMKEKNKIVERFMKAFIEAID